MARKPTPLIETVFKFLGFAEGYRDIKRFGKEAGDALDDVAKKAAMVTKGVTQAVQAVNKTRTAKIAAAVGGTLAPNMLGRGAIAGATGLFGGIGTAASLAFAPVAKLFSVVKSVAGLAVTGVGMAFGGLTAVGQWGLDAGRMFVDRFKQALMVGGGIAAALSAQLVSTAGKINEVGNQAAFAGVTTEQFSTIKALVDNAGGDVDGAAKALRSFRDVAVAAFEDPASEAGKTLAFFQQFGLKLTDETGQLRNSFELLKEVRGVFQDGRLTPTQEGILAGQLFGKEGGTSFLQVLKTTDEAWNQTARDTIDSGNMISKSQVNLAKVVKSAWGSIGDAIGGIGNKLFTEVGETFSQLLTGISSQIKGGGYGIVGVLSRIVYRIIGVVADLTAIASSQDKEGYNFVNPWMRALASLRDRFISLYGVITGDAGARLANPELTRFFALITDQLWPRLKAVGSGLFDFFNKLILPILIMVTGAIQGLLPVVDFLGGRMQWLADKVTKFFNEIGVLIVHGGDFVDPEWKWIVTVAGKIDWLYGKMKDFVGYMGGVFKTIGQWNDVRLVAKNEGMMGLQQREAAGELPTLDPKFAWVAKGLTALESGYKKTAAVLKSVSASIVEAMAPHLEAIGELLRGAGQWLLEFASNLAAYLTFGKTESSFDWIPKTVDVMKQLVGFLTSAYGYMTSLATAFSQFTQGIDVTDERFAGLFSFLEVLKRAFNTINAIVKDIGAAFGMDGISAQVAFVALAFTGLGQLMARTFVMVGAAILANVVAPLLKAAGLQTLLALPKKILAVGALAAVAAAAGSGIYHTMDESRKPDGDTSKVPGQVWNDLTSPLAWIMKKMIPDSVQDAYTGATPKDKSAGDWEDQSRNATRAYDYGRTIQMNPDAADDLTPYTQRAANAAPTTAITVNIDGRKQAEIRTSDAEQARRLAAALERMNTNDAATSMRATPVDF